MSCFLSIFILCISIFTFCQSIPLLLIVSFGGFRSDYPLIYGPLKNFSRLQKRGVYAHSLIPTFATTTYPNHYTLITGLYEEAHGLVSEQIFDPQTNSTFQSSENMTNRWWPIKSIWTINEQRSNARSGVISWPQSSITISKYEPYKKERSFKDTIDLMLSWFTNSNEPINFGAIYFDEPDRIGRETGPYSEKMREVINKCDEYIGYLLDEIDSNIQLKNNLHLIVTSDHGMEQVNGTDKPMCLEDYIDMTKIKAFGTETVLNIFVTSPNDMNDIFKNLSQIPHSKVYLKDSMPDHYHYKSNSRIGDIIIILDAGYELHRRTFYNGIKANFNQTHGNTGYDNRLDSMKTIFYAIGPELKTNFTLSNATSLANVDLFSLMCIILNIDRCPPSNGSLANIQHLLIDPTKVLHSIERETEKLQDGPMGLVIYLLVLVSFVLILIMAVVWSAVSYRNARPISHIVQSDPAMIIAEQNQYKFTQINDRKLHPIINDDNL